MAWLALILFGVLQGIAEFLPVSSSGHLTLFQYYSEAIPESLSLNIAVHVGTLVSILYFYREALIELYRGLLAKDTKSWNLFIHIVCASIPTAILGLLLKKMAPEILTHPMVAAMGLLVTGFVLISLRRLPPMDPHSLTPGKSFLVGCVQGLAVLPGLSRSGLTITAALWMKTDKLEAARFSFLISLPAIAGAALLEGLSSKESIEWGPMIIATLISCIVGLWAIRLVVDLTQKQRLSAFAYYVWLIGGFALCHMLFM